MKKILLAILMSISLTSSLYSVEHTSVSKVIVKNGISYLEVTIDCDNIDEICSEDITRKDMDKIKAIAKMKSAKSWSRLMESGNLELINVSYRNNKKILTFIICYSHDSKLVNNSYGSEIFRNVRNNDD